MDLESDIKTFAEAWAAASLKMEKSSCSPSLPLPTPWDSFLQAPNTLSSLPLWPPQSLSLQNMANFKAHEREKGTEENYIDEGLTKHDTGEKSWEREARRQEKVSLRQ